jgi:hypothetical protein
VPPAIPHRVLRFAESSNNTVLLLRMTHEAHLPLNRWSVRYFPIRLVVLQLIMPELSFVGHLSGIVAGTLQLYGFLGWAMPSDTLLLQMDDWSCGRRLAATPSFVPTMSYTSLPLGNTLSTIRATLGTRLGSIVAPLQSTFRSMRSPTESASGERPELHPLAASENERGHNASRLPTSHIV